MRSSLPHFLFASGSNAAGQLGTGTKIDSHTFSPCLFADLEEGAGRISRIRNIASGACHTLLALDRCGDSGGTFTELWGCGDGSKGQLGPTYLKDVLASGAGCSIFRKIHLPLDDYRWHPETSSYRLIASSWETTYVVLSLQNENDRVISMGADTFGCLGVGGVKGNERPGSLHIVDFDHVLAAGTTTLVVGAIAAGPQHVVVHLRCTLADGSTNNILAGWGNSRHGELGKVSGPLLRPRLIPVNNAGDPVVALGAGTQHTAVLHASGRVSVFGSNRKGQLWGIDRVEGVISLACTWNGTYLMVEMDGISRILATGSHAKGQLGRHKSPNPMETPEDVPLGPVEFPSTFSTRRILGMASGSEHVVCLFDVGTSDSDCGNRREVWGWGWNEHGNLGNGTIDDILLPQRIWPSTSSLDHTPDQGSAAGVWAGCGTTWVAAQQLG